MIPAFQTFSDPNGNLWVADGWVSQLRSGVRLPAGNGEILPPWPGNLSASRYASVPASTSGTFVGGSGRNVITTGLTPAISGPALPVGIWQPARPGIFTLGTFTLTVTGASAATIHDGSDTVAILSTGGTAPAGNYASTTYGAATYHAAAAFTLACAAEQGAPGVIPSFSLSLSDGTAVDGIYAATDAATYVAASDANWSIVIATDGSAQLLDHATVIAERPYGSPFDPEGIYEATSAGMSACHGGAAWRAFVHPLPTPARAGFVYLRLTESADVLSSVTGPFLATALPADGSGVFHVPLAQSDGLGGLVQYHTGLLSFALPGGDPGPSGAAGAAGAAGADGGPDITTRALFILGL